MSLEAPRWPGGPKICVASNLPAFESRKAMKAFQFDNLSNVTREWECDDCGCFHYEAKARAPAGSSSGNERPFDPIPGKYGNGTRPWEEAEPESEGNPKLFDNDFDRMRAYVERGAV